MEITLQEIVFYVVAAAIAVCSVLAVTTGKILRAATYLLFVLFGTGAIYGILGYTFLGAVQLMVYAGGIVVLYVFSILLTQSDKDMKYRMNRAKLISVLLTTLVGAALVLFPGTYQRICPQHDSAGRGTAGTRNRSRPDRYGEIPVHTAVRSCQHLTACLHDRRYPDSKKR